MLITAFGDFLESGTYTFHSGFEHIDNFVNSKGAFVSLASDMAYLAPNIIIINDFISEKYAELIIDEDYVFLNSNKYLLDKSLLCSSDFVYPEISLSETAQKIHSFTQLYASLFPPKSLFFLLHNENKKHFTSAFEKAFVQQMELAYALFQSDIIEGIKAFKSRGSGLTPSGDDFIAGILFGIDLLEKTKGINFNKIKDNIYEASKSNNVFSNNMLRMAYHARYFKRLQDFLNAFFYLPLNQAKPAFEQMIAVGDTSGADLLTGFFTIILFYRRETQRKRKEPQRIF